MSLYKDASLVMIPSAYKDGKLYSIRPTDGSGDFTFSRGSNLAATRVDVNGLIEKGRENRLLHSNDFSNVAWDKNIVTLAGNQSDKDGGTDAWKITANSTGLFRRLQQTTNKNEVVASSIYAKAGTADHIYLVHSSGSYSSGGYQFFDLTNGTLGASSFIKVIDASIESVGNGWYRCTLISQADAQGQCYFGLSDGDVDTTITSGNYIYIQDAQLEAGLVATDYIETGASTAQAGILEDMPRLDYSGGASCPALLLEPQRTNKLPYSEYFGAFAQSDVSLDFGYLAPDGTNSAYKVTNTSAGSGGSLYKDGLGLLADDTRSIWARTTSGTGSVDLLTYYDNTNNTFSITEEWQRFSVSSVTTSTGQGNFYAVDFRGGGLDEVILWGGQAEVGSYPTSYIPTYGSSVTRSKDHCLSSSLTASTDFTIFFEAPDFCLINGSTGGAFSNIQFVFSSNGSSYPVDGSYHIYNNSLYYWNGSTNTSFGVIYNNQTDSKFALVKRGDSMIVFANGSKVNEVTLPSGSDAKAVNWDTISLTEGTLTDAQGDVFNPYYKQLAKFDTALTDSECIALTTI